MISPVYELLSVSNNIRLGVNSLSGERKRHVPLRRSSKIQWDDGAERESGTHEPTSRRAGMFDDGLCAVFPTVFELIRLAVFVKEIGGRCEMR